LPPLGDYSANEVLNRKPFGNSLAAAGSIQLLCNPSSAIKTGADDLAANWLRSSDPNFIRMLLILVRPIHASHATPTQFVGSRSLLSQAPGFAAAINRNSAVTSILANRQRANPRPLPAILNIPRQTAMGENGLIG
jgi:hypothetical protein